MASVRGQRFMQGFAAAIALVAVLGYFALRDASHLRFAVSIHCVPASPAHDLVALQRPILVRIEKATAGRSALHALAMLLDGNGELVSGLRPLQVKTLPSGKLIEEAEFPPLTSLPGLRLLAAVVLRLPADTAESRARIEQAQQQGLLRKGGLPRVFSHILAASKAMGGHAELAQVEVREYLRQR